MKVACDLCRQVVEDSLLQILEQGGEILYVCPECYARTQEDSPDKQA